jgi:hypothetical protein
MGGPGGNTQSTSIIRTHSDTQPGYSRTSRAKEISFSQGPKVSAKATREGGLFIPHLICSKLSTGEYLRICAITAGSAPTTSSGNAAAAASAHDDAPPLLPGRSQSEASSPGPANPASVQAQAPLRLPALPCPGPTLLPSLPA